MITTNFTILYVADLAQSQAHYQKLLSLAPVQEVPGFTLFVLPDQSKLGLWQSETVLPETQKPGHGTHEICCQLSSPAEVTAQYQNWQKQGFTIIQDPIELPFGFTFVIEDPDHHRLRILAPAG